MEISATPPPSPPRRARSGPIPFLNDPHPARSSPLNVTEDEWMPLGRAAHLSTALIDYLLQRSLPEELPGTTIVGSSNAMRYMEQYVKIRNSNSRSDVRLVETMQRQYTYYALQKFTFVGVNCSMGHLWNLTSRRSQYSREWRYTIHCAVPEEQ